MSIYPCCGICICNPFEMFLAGELTKAGKRCWRARLSIFTLVISSESVSDFIPLLS